MTVTEDVRGETCPRCSQETRRHVNDPSRRYCSRCDMSFLSAPAPVETGARDVETDDGPSSAQDWFRVARRLANENAALRAAREAAPPLATDSKPSAPRTPAGETGDYAQITNTLRRVASSWAAPGEAQLSQTAGVIQKAADIIDHLAAQPAAPRPPAGEGAPGNRQVAALHRAVSDVCILVETWESKYEERTEELADLRARLAEAQPPADDSPTGALTEEIAALRARDWKRINDPRSRPEAQPPAGETADPMRWWASAGFVAPFTPTGMGGNDGKVRDVNGYVVADTNGAEARADVIAALLNRECAARSAASVPPTGAGERDDEYDAERDQFFALANIALRSDRAEDRGLARAFLAADAAYSLVLAARTPDERGDAALLDWLEAQGNASGWVARDSSCGRGYRLHQPGPHQNPRAALAATRSQP